MRKLVGGALALSLALLVLTAATRAQAFCGFYVAGADRSLFNDATMVVMMRDGKRTVLSMRNDYVGPPEAFAMVVPVPVVLQKENVKTLPTEVFDAVDALGAPRLVEYWEMDPCESLKGGIGGIGFGAGAGSGQGFGSGHGRLGKSSVKVEAQFEVGEYEVVILSASDSAGLDTWLRDEGYRIPEGAEPHLRPYVARGSKFFVAKVDPDKVTFEDGRARLSPLRFHYDSERFELPIKLGLINSQGKQDLIVNIIAKSRYQAANYPNVTVPTNLDVTAAAKERFGEVYIALFDETLKRHPKAVVTEYAWTTAKCDPCPRDPLNDQQLLTLGADVLPSVDADTAFVNQSPQVRMKKATLSGAGTLPPEVVQRIVRQNFGRFRLCQENALRNGAPGKDRIELHFTIDAKGESANHVAKGSGDAGRRTCFNDAMKGLRFPQPERGPVNVRLPIEVDMVAGRGSSNLATGMTLTRLHARYAKDGLGEDLVFEKAEPIQGGREIRDGGGALERGSKPGRSNNFQARYAIRHPWEGEVACENPVRGRWGGPRDPMKTPRPLAAANIGVIGGGATLADFVPGDPFAKNAPAPKPAPSASAAPAPTASASPSAPPGSGGCACRQGGPTPPSGSWLWLVAAALTVTRRRARPC